MSLRIVLIGCVESTHVTLETLLDRPAGAQVVGLLTRRSSTFNTDFVDLTPVAVSRGIPVLHLEDARDDAAQAAWLRGLAPDLVFCVGWSSLLGPETMGVPPRGTVGYHPAELPANRGRHPLIWSLVLGLPRTASSFFVIEAEADSGPLLSQVPVDIADDDDAATLYAKVMAVVPMQLREIVAGLADGTLQPRPQDVAHASHWRKRSARDGLIDWRMSAQSIYNLVRALNHPYPGAEAPCGDGAAKVWRCAAERDAPANAEPGKVLAVAGREITVKCGDGAVRLLSHELPESISPGDYL